MNPRVEHAPNRGARLRRQDLLGCHQRAVDVRNDQTHRFGFIACHGTPHLNESSAHLGRITTPVAMWTQERAKVDDLSVNTRH
jgi:hypothetical protein